MRYDDDTFIARLPNGERVRLRVKRDIEKLNDLDPGERLAAMLKMFPNPSESARSYNKFLEIFMGKADRDELDHEDDGGGGASDHVLSRLADSLVESGRFTDRGHALRHLTSHPDGVALVRTHKAKDDPPMTDTVYSIMKDGGIAGVCATIIAKGTTTITEHEIVDSVSKIAAERYPGLTQAQAFDKVYSDRGEEGLALRKAVSIAKAMPFVADLTPLVVGGVDATHEAINSTESSEAYAQLKELGRRKWPTASEAQQFANAFTDPANRELAQKAHRTPTPPANGAYPFPR
jgi:hypothetical protein